MAKWGYCVTCIMLVYRERVYEAKAATYSTIKLSYSLNAMATDLVAAPSRYSKAIETRHCRATG